MNKRYFFIFMVFFLAFLVIQFVKTGYFDSQRAETLRIRESEIIRYENEITQLTSRVRWGDTPAARVYLKKLYSDVRLPGERIIVLIPKQESEYSINSAIDAANQSAQSKEELTVPEKWNKLLFNKI
ncbi:hypothetical protein KA050_00825 [Candidatus Gracilibacteria bacterium]|nr:hypothetical protein [Candidatus Gracilibacteria bacterium]